MNAEAEASALLIAAGVIDALLSLLESKIRAGVAQPVRARVS